MHTHTLSCIRVYLHKSCLSISQSLYLSIYVPTAKARGVSELFMIWCLPVWVPGTVRLSGASRVMGNPVRLSDASRVMGHGEPGAIITNLSDASRVMGNPVQFTCRRTARARTAGARTAGTRNASMGSASAQRKHAQRKHKARAGAPPRRSRRMLHKHTTRPARSRAARTRTAMARAAGTRNASAGTHSKQGEASAKTSRGATMLQPLMFFRRHNHFFFKSPLKSIFFNTFSPLKSIFFNSFWTLPKM